MNSTKQLFPAVPADYIKLVRRFPLRPIRDEADYDRAAEVLDGLVTRNDLTPGESDYMEALTEFVSKYDDAHYPIEPTGRTPLDRLRDAMESSGTDGAALGKILGSRSAASMILNGKRALSRTHVLKLAAHFKMKPGYFL